jgi:hypothetical protein
LQIQSPADIGGALNCVDVLALRSHVPSGERSWRGCDENGEAVDVVLYLFFRLFFNALQGSRRNRSRTFQAATASSVSFRPDSTLRRQPLLSFALQTGLSGIDRFIAASNLFMFSWSSFVISHLLSKKGRAHPGGVEVHRGRSSYNREHVCSWRFS